MTAAGVTLSRGVECFSCAQAELLRCRSKSSFARDDSEWNALWLRRQRNKFHAIIEAVVEGVRGHGYPRAGVPRRKKPGPTIVLLHDARLVLHACEDGINIYPVLRIFLVQ